MTFGEKVRSLRKEKKMSQQELASMVGVSYRTIRSWEVEGRFPKQNVLYQKLADALQCDVSYLMSENEAFITEASEQFGNRGARQAQQILEQAAAMFAGGSLTDEDKIAFMDEIQSLYLDSKRRAALALTFISGTRGTLLFSGKILFTWALPSWISMTSFCAVEIISTLTLAAMTTPIMDTTKSLVNGLQWPPLKWKTVKSNGCKTF